MKSTTTHAIYVSVWDGGKKIKTRCKINLQIKLVSDVASEDDCEDLDLLEEEYVELPDGTIIRDFATDDGRVVTEGQLVED